MNVCKDPAKKSAVVKNVGEKLHKRYMEGKPSWLFKTLRF